MSPEQLEQQRRYRRLKSRRPAGGGTLGLGSMSSRRALGIGTAVAIAIYAVPFTRFVLSYLAILVHELGHTLVGMLFGYPSFPTLDFFYGGGVTLYFGRSTAFLVLVGVGLAWAVYRFRHWPRVAALMGAGALVWLVAASTSFHDVFLNAAGHGAELLFAGWCFFKVLSGNVRSNTERWLYAMCGSFLVLSAWMFSLRLIQSEVARREYGQAKGGGHWMDMSRLSRYFDADLVSIALLYWLLATLVPVAVHLLWLNRTRIGAWFGAR